MVKARLVVYASNGDTWEADEEFADTPLVGDEVFLSLKYGEGDEDFSSFVAVIKSRTHYLADISSDDDDEGDDKCPRLELLADLLKGEKNDLGDAEYLRIKAEAEGQVKS